MIVGDRIVRTCRSTNDSQEQSAMPRQGTHMRQSIERDAVVGATASMAISFVRLKPDATLLRRDGFGRLLHFGLVRGQPALERLQLRVELLARLLAARTEHRAFEVAVDLEHVAQFVRAGETEAAVRVWLDGVVL